jgi:hypothetical protein
MTFNSRFINYGSLILLSVLVAVGAFYLYDKYGNAQLDPFDAIPENSSAFVKINEPGSLIRGLSGKNEIWNDLIRTDRLGAILSKFDDADSILNSMGYEEMLETGNLFLALEGDSGQMALCVLFKWPYGASEGDVDMLLKQLSGRALYKTNESFHDIDGYCLQDSIGPLCYYCIDHGLCMIGSTPGILESCAKRIDDKSENGAIALFIGKVMTLIPRFLISSISSRKAGSRFIEQKRIGSNLSKSRCSRSWVM